MYNYLDGHSNVKVTSVFIDAVEYQVCEYSNKNLGVIRLGSIHNRVLAKGSEAYQKVINVYNEGGMN